MARLMTRRGRHAILAAMKKHLIPLMFLLYSAMAGARESWLSLEAWDRPLDGDAVTAFDVLREAVDRLDRDARLRLAIRYPGGEAGLFRAHGLRQWLIALGVSGQRLRLVPGAARDDRLELVLEADGP